MASVNNSDIMKIFKFMGEFWTFIKMYFILEEADIYWESLIADAAALGHKYDDDRLAVHLINAYLDYLEEKYRDIQKGSKDGKTNTGR